VRAHLTHDTRAPGAEGFTSRAEEGWTGILEKLDETLR